MLYNKSMQHWIQRIQESKILVAIVGSLLVVWFGYNTTLSILRNYELAQKIDDLENEIAILELENQNLKFQIGYYKTDAFLELEARDKLSKVAAGEKLLILPENRYDAIAEAPDNTIQDKTSQISENLSAWTNFLFGD